MNLVTLLIVMVVSGVISDVNMAETSNGNQREEIHLTQDTEQENGR